MFDFKKNIKESKKKKKVEEAGFLVFDFTIKKYEKKILVSNLCIFKLFDLYME